MANQVLVLSDNDGVARVVELAIGQEAQTTTLLLNPDKPANARLPSEHCALIILALSSVASEPVVALARTSLACLVGQVPLLIISERPFLSDVQTHIHHMDFPFTISELSNLVHLILQSEMTDAALPMLAENNLDRSSG
jgi:hypothetical protein